jgi:sigma-B regulation protein RsbU (phosphoserine phosphatase)
MLPVEELRIVPAPGIVPDKPAGLGTHAVRRFRSGLQARATSLPATEFTGDFYTTCEIGDDVWFAVGDFSGHGLGAAIFAMMVREELDRSIDHCRHTCLVEIVGRLDGLLRDEFPSNRFASLVVGRAAQDGRVTLVNAGHCHPLVLRAGGALESIAPGGPVVGIVPAPAWSSTSTRLDPGDRLLVYTDGLLEARDADDDEFGTDRIAALASGADPGSTIDTLLDEVTRFTRGKRDDDLTVFMLSRG